MPGMPQAEGWSWVKAQTLAGRDDRDSGTLGQFAQLDAAPEMMTPCPA